MSDSEIEPLFDAEPAEVAGVVGPPNGDAGDGGAGLDQGDDADGDEGQALCLHCLEPVDTVLDHYCPRCGYAVGQLTPYIPFVSIRFEAQIWGNLWRRLWYEPGSPAWQRVIAFAVIAFGASVMLVGLPFVIWDKWGPSPDP